MSKEMNLICCFAYMVLTMGLSESFPHIQFPGFHHRPHHPHHYHHYRVVTNASKDLPTSSYQGLKPTRQQPPHGQQSPTVQQTPPDQQPPPGQRRPSMDQSPSNKLVVFPKENISVADLTHMNPQLHDVNNPPHASISTQKFHEFRYEGKLGPENWPVIFPNCTGEFQSPIAINQGNTQNAQLGKFVFKNYDLLPSVATMTNNGHTVMVHFPTGATISGGGLPGEFEFLNLHFHWGNDSSRGSEHVIEGIHYPLELHMVHWNYNYFSFEEAMHHPDGIAVLAVLFHTEPLNNPVMKSFVEELESILPSDSSKSFKPGFKLMDLLPADTDQFYRYTGSLTTPQCNEAVIWTIFAHTLPISEVQMNEFRKVLDPENHDRENNFRPVQPLNERTIYRNKF